MKKRKKEWKRCGEKAIISALIILMFSLTAQAQLTSSLTIQDEKIYRKESTELNLTVENSISGSEINDIQVKINSEKLDLSEKVSIGQIDPGESFKKTLKIKTYRNTSVGIHKIQGRIKYDNVGTPLTPVELEVDKIPLKLETSFEKEETPRDGNNTLEMKITNQGETPITDIEIEPNFARLRYLETDESCKRQIDELRKEESFTLKCQFRSTEEASGEYSLPINMNFKDASGETHTFEEYIQVPVESGINIPGGKSLIIGIIIIIGIFALLKIVL